MTFSQRINERYTIEQTDRTQVRRKGFHWLDNTETYDAYYVLDSEDPDHLNGAYFAYYEDALRAVEWAIEHEPHDDGEVGKVRHPEIKVQLSGATDGNASVILGAVNRAMQRSGIASTEIDEFNAEAMAGDYDHLVQTCMKWVTVT